MAHFYYPKEKSRNMFSSIKSKDFISSNIKLKLDLIQKEQRYAREDLSEILRLLRFRHQYYQTASPSQTTLDDDATSPQTDLDEHDGPPPGEE